MPTIGGLYVLIDPAACRGRNPVEVGRAALQGGARMIQWRDKQRDKGEQLPDARALYELCQRHDAIFIVNDHADLALVLAAGRSPERGAIGVHVGQHDLPLEALWSIVPDYFVVGSSTNNRDEALAAEKAGADYVAVGDLFGTAAKEGTRPASPARLKQIKEQARVPVIGIGGINVTNVAEVMVAGADGIAVISAVCGADDPEAAARALLEAMRR
ncbi:MAG TPA: thiamine phosphate synthase [Dehalococcoidia bacterium]|nr:thiamine phosphate synthase [Dehalococcoidia bacterium]